MLSVLSICLSNTINHTFLPCIAIFNYIFNFFRDFWHILYMKRNYYVSRIPALLSGILTSVFRVFPSFPGIATLLSILP